MAIRYSTSDAITADQFTDVLRRSKLAERRPVDRRSTIEAMLSGADVLVTAWHGDRLVGVSRAVSDFAYCTYLSDLAVDVAFQNRGIGKELVRRTRELVGLDGSLILLAAPTAEAYYPKLGMKPHRSCWVMPGRPTPKD